METTITIDDEILEQLKERAAKEATTVSQLIEDSVRLAVLTHAERPVEKPFKLVTFGRGGDFTDLDADRTFELIELDDIARYGPPR